MDRNTSINKIQEYHIPENFLSELVEEKKLQVAKVVDDRDLNIQMKSCDAYLCEKNNQRDEKFTGWKYTVYYANKQYVQNILKNL